MHTLRRIKITTIIAHKGQLTADRRKVVNGNGVGLIGIRDETKIQTTPYCIYAVSGFEFDDRHARAAKANHQQRLAALYALNYFTEQRLLDTEFYKRSILDLDGFFKFRDRCLRLRNLLGSALADKLEERDAGMLAMGWEDAFVLYRGVFSCYPNSATAVIGAGRKMTSILLDHGMSFPDIYDAVRSVGVPTGVAIETYTARAELQDLFPPVLDDDFIFGLFDAMDDLMDSEVKRSIRSAKEKREMMEMVTEMIATFYSFGDYKDGHIHFSNDIRFDFSSAEARETKWFQAACEITGLEYKVEEKQ